jgi:hypothetical protein
MALAVGWQTMHADERATSCSAAGGQLCQVARYWDGII